MRLLAALFVSFVSFVDQTHAADKPIKVFILSGQSNMEGHAAITLLEYQVTQPAYQPLFGKFQKDGKWIERDDVWIKFLDRHGPLTIGYGAPKCIGPELAFGWTVGDHYEEPVLLIKPAWGGRSVWRDFRPPSAGLPSDADLQKQLENAKKNWANAQKKKPDPSKPEPTMEDIKKPFGVAYRDMLQEVRTALGDLKTYVPGYHDQGYDLAGFIWFQGWNDMIDPKATAEYTANLTHFIQDVRKDLKAPELPFVIAQMGVDGENPNEHIKTFKAAEAAVLDAPEFKDDHHLALVKTDVFWDKDADAVFKQDWRKHQDEWNKVGSNYGFHYYGSARTLCAIGQACAEAVLKMQKP